MEYTPAEVKRAVVGYGRAEKHQVQAMIKLLLGLTTPPSPHDAADALAVAICHLHSMAPAVGDQSDSTRSRIPDPDPRSPGRRRPRTWRQYRPPASG